MAKIKIGLIQYPLTKFKTQKEWEKSTLKWLAQAQKKNVELLVFPEYGSMELVSLLPNFKKLNLNEQLHQLQDFYPHFFHFFLEAAQKFKMCIVAPSFPVFEKRKFINRALVFSKNGQFSFQDKIKMTRFEDEIWGIQPGQNQIKIFRSGPLRFGISICFDSEFPVFGALLAHAGCDLLLAPSCTETLWGHHRVHTGCRARALENQFYVAVSPIVKDSKWCEALDRNMGQAALYGPSDKGFPADGEIAKGPLNRPALLVSEIDTEKIKKVRKEGGVFNFKHSSEMLTLKKHYSVQTVDF